MEISKNQIYEIKITDLGTEGEGIGKIDGFTVFVPYALTDEVCQVLIVKVNKNFAFGKLLKIITPSPERLEPLCPVFYKCGGCTLQHLSYNAEKNFKTKRVRDCVERIAKINTPVYDVIGSPKTENYRNKALFPVTCAGIGFYAPRSHRVVEFENCLIQSNESNHIKSLFEEFIKENNVAAYDEINHTGDFRGLFIRGCRETNELMVCIITRTKNLPFKEELIEIFKNAGATSIIQNINTKVTNVALGEEFITLYGNEKIKAKIGDYIFNISPKSFLQINPEQTKNLYDKVNEFADLTGKERVLDLYCGAGTIGIYIAKNAKSVTGVEIVPDAVLNAKENADLNNISNIDFICGKTEEIAETLGTADVVITDPPRKGCGEEFIKAIDIINPKKIIYVSCNPATLARDIARLSEIGYKTEKVQPFDMFPRTCHVETVALLTKLKESDSITVELDLDELEVSAPKTKATYSQIKEYVLNKYGFKVSSLNIAQVKQECGITERENYNKPSDDYKQPKCPKHKADAIKDAFEHFRMI